ncbi:FabD/lysophospholipase-like protein, partial [Pyrenochaeta sp. DS3sAY3a]
KTLFSATHLHVLFEAALKHVAGSITTRFNFVHASRRFNPVEDDFVHHLEDFLCLSSKLSIDEKSLLKYLASAIVLDSLPPGTHHFSARDIFTSIYKSHCHSAFVSEDRHSPTEWCALLDTKYCELVADLEVRNLAAASFHEQNLEALKIDWQRFRSSRTCLYCLRRKPEHGLPCGHAICDTCASIFGTKRDHMEYSYQISHCRLCQKPGDLTIHFKPPTAGSRLLVLDGGGIRGAFTLQVLQALDHYRRLPYPIYDDFDLALGSSSGGLIVLMFLLRRSLKECISAFNKLAQRVFTRKKRLGGTFFAKLCSLLSSVLTDSIYGADGIESCVREAFDNETVMFGCSKRARATSAAPAYFPAKFIRGLGFVQDGGAGKHNNPIDPAEWESKAIWNTTPDLALSIGTGYARDPVSPRFIPQRMRFRDRFLLRLCRLFNAFLNAQGNWDDHLNRVKDEERHKYFRINVALDEEPSLDDVEKIPDMEAMAHKFLKSFDFSSMTRSLFAASFFFELCEMPAVGKDGIYCHGIIRCRSPNSRALIQRILEEYPAASFNTDHDSGLGGLNIDSLCAMCGLFSKVVNLNVCHSDHKVSICVKFNRLGKHPISGFPQTISQVVDKQKLNAQFGRPDHKVSGFADVSGCRCKLKSKRKWVTTRNVTVSKRRRISPNSAHSLLY